MRRAAKVDRNQAEIVQSLRSIGATVQPLHAVGEGCPDLLVGFRGVNYLIEVKDWQNPPSKRQLNAVQEEWHGGWKGQVAKIETVDAAIALVTGQINITGKVQ
jgi:hypothetical protein